MAAAKLDIYVDQGQTWSKVLTFTNRSDGSAIDITGYTFRGQIRDYYDASVVRASFTFTAGAADNKKVATLPAATTAALPAASSGNKIDRKYTLFTYDIEATKPDSTEKRYLQGTVFMSPEVTRA